MNRISMYNIDHPAAIQCAEELLKALREGFRIVPSLSFIMLLDKFFLEEQPFDPRINTSKMLPHFKKAQIQSLSFERGLSETELRGFLKVFSDPKTYPTAESITTALNQLEISHLKVNHTFLQKMTQDDQIISRETVPETSSALTKTADGIGTDVLKKVLTEQIILEELEKSLSLHTLVEDPTKFSQALVQSELFQQRGENSEAGFIVSQQLRQINQEVEQTSTATEPVDLLRIADSIFAMKKNLIEELKAQKALGVVFSHEDMIMKETNALTDQVLVRIVREEYNQGEISIPRLAQIIRRLLPEPGEIKRLLPLLKKALLAEGMSLVEFLRLIQELGKELETEGLVQVLKESAENIGLSGDDLIKEVKRDPAGAAELIFLAAEIRRGSGDDKVFCEILGDYVESIGSELALDAAAQKEEGGKHLKEIISQVQSGLLSRFQGKLDSQLLGMVEQKLDDHLEELLKQTTSAWVTRKISLSDDISLELPSFLTLIEESVDNENDIQIILEKIISSLRAQGFAEDKLKIIADEIANRARTQKKESEKKIYPKGALNRGNILFLLKKEIARAWRYTVPFSTLTLSLVNIIPKTPVSSEEIKLQDVWFSVMECLTKIMRDADFLGVLEENKILLLFPMTDEKGSGLALQRILKILHSESFIVKDIPLELKFVALTTSFNQDKMPTIQIFLKEIRTKMQELLKIQKNVKLSL
jgi:hypothetical protein